MSDALFTEIITSLQHDNSCGLLKRLINLPLLQRYTHTHRLAEEEVKTPFFNILFIFVSI